VRGETGTTCRQRPSEPSSARISLIPRCPARDAVLYLLALHLTFRAGAHRVANSRARRVVTLPAAHRVAVLLLHDEAEESEKKLGLSLSCKEGSRRTPAFSTSVSTSVATAATTSMHNNTTAFMLKGTRRRTGDA
jgi:hypothetical protein